MTSPLDSTSRRLAAVWFADIVGFTRLAARDEGAALDLVTRFQQAVQGALAAHGGRLIKFLGDGALVEFGSADAAVRAALTLQGALSTSSGPGQPIALVRIGIHLGEIVTVADGDIYGDGVNVASRLQREAAPGQVVVSEDVWRSLRQRPDFFFTSLGERSLRGVPGPVRLFVVGLEGRVESPGASGGGDGEGRSIAVLPFVDISPDHDNEYFSDGMTEELISALTRVQGLRVASRTSSFAFKGKDVGVNHIGEALRVATVLEGSVRKAGNRLRITPQLISVSDGYHLWTETYDREMEDVFAVQEEISRAIVHALQVQLGPAADAPIVRRATADAEAYNLYLKGRYAWNRHGPDDLQAAIGHFKAAIAIDADYARAYAGLADCYLTLGALHLSPPKEIFPKAKIAALKALELDEQLAEAHAAVGEVHHRYDWAWADAERDFKRAIELDPDYAEAHKRYANGLRDLGRLDEALTAIERAEALDPLSNPIRVARAGILHFARRHEDAAMVCQAILEAEPTFYQASFYLGNCRLEQGRFDEALAEFEKVVGLSGVPAAIGMLGYGYARAGRRDDALRVLAQLETMAETAHVSGIIVGQLQAALGNTQEAFACFDQAVQQRSSWLSSLLVEPRMDTLRTDPRFSALLRKVGLVGPRASLAGGLPAPATPLVGRETAVAALGDLLGDPSVRLVTLTGPGGMGKTRLALAVARALEEDFPDGVAFVSLAALKDPGLVESSLARGLGVAEIGGTPVHAALTAFLSDRRILLVLDGFEPVLAAAPYVAELLESTPRLKILATSRAALRVRGEHEFPVSPLALPDPAANPSLEQLGACAAVALFVQGARSVKPSYVLTAEDGPAVSEICRRLDGLPLAIELAAARVKLMPPQAMLGRLGHRLDFLREGPRDLPARQRTLRATFDWSYELLSGAEQTLFRQLAVFVGGFSLDVAEAVCRIMDEPCATLLDGLGSLVDNSLLRQTETPEGEARFEMLETVREYADALLSEQGETEAARARHAEAFLALAERAEAGLAGADQVVWLNRLERDNGNVQAVLDWTLQRGDIESAMRLGSALWWFWWVRGYFGAMRQRLELAFQRRDVLPGWLRANLLVASGAMASLDGDDVRAAALYEEAIAVERARGSRSGIPRALRSFAFTLSSRGEFAQATSLFEEALALDRELDNRQGIAAALRGLGKMALYQGDAARAGTRFAESLALSREQDDAQAAAFALSGLGDLARQAGDGERAAALYAEGLALCRQLGSKPGIAYLLQDSADAARDAGDLDRAAGQYAEALGLLKELGNRRRIALCLVGIAAIAAVRGHHERAAHLFGAVDALYGAGGWYLPPTERADIERCVGVARTGLGEPAYDRAHARGRALTRDQAIALALAAPQNGDAVRAR